MNAKNNILQEKPQFNPWEIKIDSLELKDDATVFLEYFKKIGALKNNDKSNKLEELKSKPNPLKSSHIQEKISKEIKQEDKRTKFEKLRDIKKLNEDSDESFYNENLDNNQKLQKEQEINDDKDNPIITLLHKKHGILNVDVFKNTNFYNLINLERSNYLLKRFYEELIGLEELYEQFKYRNILSKDEEYKQIDNVKKIYLDIKTLNESRFKILNLVKNTSLTDSSSINIFYESHSKFLSTLKELFYLMSSTSDLNYIVEMKQLNIGSIEKIFEEIELMMDKFEKQIDKKEKLVFLKL